MKVRPVLAVVAALVAATPAGRRALSGLLARVRSGDGPSSATSLAPAPAALPAPAAGTADGSTAAPAAEDQPASAPLTRAPLGPDATGAEVAIDLFEHRGE